jgi:DNA-binding CsgD family transcriptional regulator
MKAEILYFLILLIFMGSAVGSILLIAELNKKFSLPFLHSLFYYELFQVIFGFYTLVGIKALGILSQTITIDENVYHIVTLVLVYIGIPFYLTAWFMYIKHSAELKSKKISGLITWIYFSGFLLLFLSYGIINTYYIQTQPAILIVTRKIYTGLFIGIELFVPIILFFAYLNTGQKSVKRPENWFIHRNYLLIFNSSHLVSVAMLVFVVKMPFFFPVFILLFFLRDLPAVLYLRIHLPDEVFAGVNNVIREGGFERFCEKFNISKREKEVIQLVIQGKTNQEICMQLFITLQTVKDHNSRIYQKTGVKNRVQLLNLISHSSK